MNKAIKFMKKHFSKRTYKAKAGATLIELMAVVCILAITSTTCIAGMFAMADVAKRGQDLSYCERTSDMLSKQLAIYGNTASYVEGYAGMPTLTAYDSTSNPGGFMDIENPTTTYGDKNDYFLFADASTDYRLILARFDTSTSPYTLKEVTTIDNVKSIKFNVKKLNLPTESKYILQYTATTLGTNVWDKATDKRVEYTVSSGVVLNNTNSSTPSIPTLTNDTIETKSPSNSASTVCLRIRTTSRSDVDIS